MFVFCVVPVGFRHSQDGGNIAVVISRDKHRRNEIKDASELDLLLRDQDGSYGNSKYDMTYFENSNPFREKPSKERGATGNNELRRKGNLESAHRKPYDTGNDKNYVGTSLHHIERKKALKHKGGQDDSLSPMAFPLEHTKHDEQVKPQRSEFDEPAQPQHPEFGDKEINKKRTSKFDNQKSEDENSLDLDIEIKPLSLSDAKYFNEEKMKHSSIPKQPTADNETPQKIEHIQTNFIDEAPEKKAKIDVLIGGRLNQAKADLVHETSPDKTYDKVKDFFKSQQVSSLVDAPVAEKKETVKFYRLSSEDKNVNVKRSSIPTPSVYPDGIRLNLKERFVTFSFF